MDDIPGTQRIPTFRENIGVFSEAMGPEFPHIIIPFSLVPWPSEAARNEFIEGLMGGGDSGGEQQEVR